MTESFTNAVRRACAADARAIVQLANRALLPEPATTPTRDTDVLQMQERGQFLVLDRNDGTLAASLFLEITDRHATVGMLAIDPEAADAGLAQRLVSVAELLCEAEGCSSLELDVASTREEFTSMARSMGYRDLPRARAGNALDGAAPSRVSKSL